MKQKAARPVLSAGGGDAESPPPLSEFTMGFATYQIENDLMKQNCKRWPWNLADAFIYLRAG